MKVFINERDQIDSQLKMLGDMLRQRFVPDSTGQIPTFEVSVERTNKRRTQSQNDAMHVYFRQLSQAMNDAGFDMVAVLKEGTEIAWNERMVKEYIWRPVQKAITGEESTTRPTTKQYQEIYETINRKIATTCGLSIPWPTRFNMENGS